MKSTRNIAEKAQHKLGETKEKAKKKFDKAKDTLKTMVKPKKNKHHTQSDDQPSKEEGKENSSITTQTDASISIEATDSSDSWDEVEQPNINVPNELIQKLRDVVEKYNSLPPSYLPPPLPNVINQQINNIPPPTYKPLPCPVVKEKRQIPPSESNPVSNHVSPTPSHDSTSFIQAELSATNTNPISQPHAEIGNISPEVKPQDSMSIIIEELPPIILQDTNPIPKYAAQKRFSFFCCCDGAPDDEKEVANEKTLLTNPRIQKR